MDRTATSSTTGFRSAGANVRLGGVLIGPFSSVPGTGGMVMLPLTPASIMASFATLLRV